jgi:MoaA/NifB/PqqE/SkfB family radical SAM enzyme
MVTNGSLLTRTQAAHLVDQQVAKVKFSIDAGTPKTYSSIRNYNFFKVLKNITRLTEEKIRRNSAFPAIEIGFVAMRRNIRDLSRLVAIAAEIGASSVRVAHCFMGAPEVAEESLRQEPELSDLEMLKACRVAGEVGIELSLPPVFDKSLFAKPESRHVSRELTRRCTDPWTFLWINHDGEGRLCCSGGTGSYGNINEMDFMDFWNHPLRRKVRRSLNNGPLPPQCARCSNMPSAARSPAQTETEEYAEIA